MADILSEAEQTVMTDIKNTVDRINAALDSPQLSALLNNIEEAIATNALPVAIGLAELLLPAITPYVTAVEDAMAVAKVLGAKMQSADWQTFERIHPENPYDPNFQIGDE